MQQNDLGNNSLLEQMKKIKKQDEEEKIRLEQEEKERLNNEKAKKLVEDSLKSSTNDTTTKNTDSSKSSNNSDVLTPKQRKQRGNLLYGTKSESDSDSNMNQGSINDSLKGEIYADGTIKPIDNPSYLLISGTTIPCVLQTKVVTNYAGFLKCLVTKNVYSSDGENLLIKKGSIIKGEQKRALTHGVARVFIAWNVIDTPDKLRIRIDSLGTDQLGASGTEAYVDNHFWERFGGAIMLSFIQDSLKTASNRISDHDNDIYYDNSENNTNRMAELALENSINIPPTGYVNQGSLINILLVRDIDFSFYR